MSWQVLKADCVEAMREMDEASVDAIVTDPPAGIHFMSRTWDHHKGGRDAWVAWLTSALTECLRVAKPGAHALIWALPRTSHWTGWAIENAGWEVRDRISHHFGSGFPKSLNIGNGQGTALKPATEDWWLARKPLVGTVAETVERFGTGALNIAATRITPEGQRLDEPSCMPDASRDIPQWPDAPAALRDALHDALRKTASELRSDSSAGTVPLRNGDGLDGTSPLDVSAGGSPPDSQPSDAWYGWSSSEVPDSQDGCQSCRRSCDGLVRRAQEAARESPPSLADALDGIAQALPGLGCIRESPSSDPPSTCGALDRIALAVDSFPYDTGYSAPQTGRWPANVVLSGSAVAELDRQSGERPGAVSNGKRVERDDRVAYGTGWGRMDQVPGYGDTGGASRFFATFHDPGDPCEAHGIRNCTICNPPRFRYVAKASRAERNAGLEGFEERETRGNYGDGIQDARPHTREGYEYRALTRNSHPTVKPVELMRWLCRLVVPPGGVCLDPFAGSGTTGIAAVLEGFDFIGIEREAEYVEIAKARIAWWDTHKDRAEEILSLSAKSERERTGHAEAGQIGLFG